ncbi:transcription termination factor rho : Transcription termination factor Rho OS=Singulisphaera acidiphila (strain ATCC BAA-1392 / DSM 18658 / VKM B-2454 / MOB10) GN=rho PE=3 SV=1: Rho_RNA_bind: ATP-synt_ab [Gemmataceae bacterium]|nr:transcription termination factor rho : Transcription termination factor Rho OS=Singulisphaera acidiphila (strain ATCC BAA-1392 / DSM 18658 / VKM B-2454 / MOB10) GN=rho PE=3 SV=1: Rho_RNA_bind: ATP-synt_ab [Gemmataceae bacterium]VTU00763.1 transcription termination factor rho : Transcription termination factor Rho OS=Singulisphaera acidiphila (strain ATCC BAA-1392 / DSM 18658 / VKM B-2454 / MOB10) GN=rho PE=3 SV=1: Rho_RNA_bind: ATP-synt_ab [Gemmataceae bacterium]
MSDPRTTAHGVLELHPKGYGFLRNPARHYAPTPADAYVSGALIDKFRLAEGLRLGGPLEPPRRGQTGPRIATVETIEGADAKLFRRRSWEELTAVDPTKWIRLETGPEPLTTRVMDMFTPIGMGQRGLIVAPPRSGKTVLLQHIAQAVIKNHPAMHLMVLLVDERPEEVTEMRRTLVGPVPKPGEPPPADPPPCEVIASSSDRDTASHIRLAGLVVERAKRLTEMGRDTFVLLDSLTRLARAHNKTAGSGRTMSGGVDSKALEVPKRLFGSARAFEEGGSLTILGTALIETGSRMDEVIFQEFKGTGNMELVLNRALAERRIYPAIDLGASGTRKEERLLPPEMLEQITLVRRSLMQMKPVEAMEGMVKQLTKTKSNAEFLMTVSKFVR